MIPTLKFLQDKYVLSMADTIEVPGVGRDDLAAVLHDLDFKIGVEVGVQRGKYSEVLCRLNPQMKVFGVDPWEAYVTHPLEDHLKTTQNHSSKEMLNKFHEQTKSRLAPYSNYEIIREYSIDAMKRFDDESLDFVYIDANHEYKYVMEDIVGWWRKIKKQGILAGHDFYWVRSRHSNMHVKKAVLDFVRENQIRPLIVWGRKYVSEGEYRDRRRSWSFVKQ